MDIASVEVAPKNYCLNATLLSAASLDCCEAFRCLKAT